MAKDAVRTYLTLLYSFNDLPPGRLVSDMEAESAGSLGIVLYDIGFPAVMLSLLCLLVYSHPVIIIGRYIIDRSPFIQSKFCYHTCTVILQELPTTSRSQPNPNETFLDRELALQYDVGAALPNVHTICAPNHLPLLTKRIPPRHCVLV